MYNDSIGKLDLKSVGMRLKEYRKSQGLTQKELSDKIEYSVTYYSSIENGNAPHINHRSLENIANMLNISSAWLIYGIDSEAPDAIGANHIEFFANDNTETKNYSRLSQYFFTMSEYLKKTPDKDEANSKSVFATMLFWLSDLDLDELETLIKCAEMQKMYKTWKLNSENRELSPEETN